MGRAPHEYGIPARMAEGIDRYVKYGLRPGGFLSAIIENNLIQAVRNADHENIKLLPNYVSYFHNEAPGLCWGSRYNVDLWIEKGGLNAHRKSV